MRKKVRDILVVIGWASAIMLLTVRALYQLNPVYRTIGSYLDAPDLLLLLAVSVVAGIFLADLNRILYGYIGSIALSISIALVYSSICDWFVIGYGEIFSQAPFGWEYVVFYAFAKILRTMFPGVMLLTFLGGFAGGILSDTVWPHQGH